MTPAELKWWILFLCTAKTIFIHPSVKETVIMATRVSKHVRNGSSCRDELFNNNGLLI